MCWEDSELNKTNRCSWRSKSNRGHRRFVFLLTLKSFIRFQEYKAFNGSKDILKGLRTPFAFALSAFVLHILSVVLDVVELDMIAGWLNYVAWISALLVALWGFLNYSGNAPGIVQQLDQGGSYLWDMFKDLLHVYIHQTQGTPLARHKKTQ